MVSLHPSRQLLIAVVLTQVQTLNFGHLILRIQKGFNTVDTLTNGP